MDVLDLLKKITNSYEERHKIYTFAREIFNEGDPTQGKIYGICKAICLALHRIYGPLNPCDQVVILANLQELQEIKPHVVRPGISYWWDKDDREIRKRNFFLLQVLTEPGMTIQERNGTRMAILVEYFGWKFTRCSGKKPEVEGEYYPILWLDQGELQHCAILTGYKSPAHLLKLLPFKRVIEKVSFTGAGVWHPKKPTE